MKPTQNHQNPTFPTSPTRAIVGVLALLIGAIATSVWHATHMPMHGPSVPVLDSDSPDTLPGCYGC